MNIACILILSALIVALDAMRIRRISKNEPSETEEYHITLLLHNKVGREIRVTPSRGRKRGYVVTINASLKVSMIFPKTADVPEPVTFKATDVETESGLEINGDIKVSIMPGKFPDEGINMTITAPAPVIKPVHSWFMVSGNDNIIPGNSDLTTHGNMTLVDEGLAFDGQESHAVAQIAPDDCVINTEKCTKLKFDKLAGDAELRYIVDTGAHDRGMRGFSLHTQQDNLVAVVRTADRQWTVESPAVLNEWVYIMVTWNKHERMKMYYNALLRGHDTTGTPVPTTTVVPYKNNLVIGREVGNNGPFHYGKFNMASFTTFAGRLPQDDVNAAYIFFWSGSLCCRLWNVIEFSKPYRSSAALY